MRKDYYSIIVAGSRTFDNYKLLSKTLDDFIAKGADGKPVCIISGGARGADSLGECYAAERKIPRRVIPAEWSLLGKAAGMVRNRKMLEIADAVVVFWDGQSKGSKNMIEIAEAAGKRMKVIRY